MKNHNKPHHTHNYTQCFLFSKNMLVSSDVLMFSFSLKVSKHKMHLPMSDAQHLTNLLTCFICHMHTSLNLLKNKLIIPLKIHQQLHPIFRHNYSYTTPEMYFVIKLIHQCQILLLHTQFTIPILYKIIHQPYILLLFNLTHHYILLIISQ